MNQWLSPELIEAVNAPVTTLRDTTAAGRPAPANRAAEVRERPQSSRNRSSRGAGAIALRAALATLLGACAAFSYVALSEAAAGLRFKPATLTAAAPPAATRVERPVQAEEIVPVVESLAPAKARVRSLREANYLMRTRLSELEAALARPAITPDSDAQTLEVQAPGTDTPPG